MTPPKARFSADTLPWHPNVSSQTGYICCTMLREEGWSPAHTLKLVLQGLQTLLEFPEWDDPLNAEVWKMHARSADAYDAHAKAWAANKALPAGAFDTLLSSVPTAAARGGSTATTGTVGHSGRASLPAGADRAGDGNGNAERLVGSWTMSTKKSRKTQKQSDAAQDGDARFCSSLECALQ